MLNNIKAAIFDLDGTLIDSMFVWEKIDVDFLSERGIDVPDNIGKITEGKSFTETAMYFKETFALSESVEEIKNQWIKMGLIYYQNNVEMKPGAKELLETLKDNGIKMGIATSCSRDLLEAVLDQHNLHKYFQSIVTSCEVKRGKPYPDVFLKVSEELNIHHKHILAFEDTVAGVLAAKAAGMKVVAVYDTHSEKHTHELKETADYYIISMEELLTVESSVG
ncbi:HAD family hydrolase [Alkaliphilus peptidifermentans]|uniref:Haloacid dehalogenase superfamily, subfamily IA, variant 3 with third motif having DD or ED/haloacid dehalogenase superfamily, subfamily IA, variant 1 with third motif having Dx(3-4)D or Dx(3-4)E n=1 Tax=Alkaliphilus peptidifermentans DSM 18978 TaxID=1120976 RepID=A0A1G5K513_9FIRM|nr:HAD family phosphatase [Alkaliphilus peptidifermentans]SCY95140.1 haloacid dehalogenase superfamily, subfamily IA, variant 3 with third motif having DD or ED/haloacid dehalogenase superfamily, subfamily IA, variant 1 with third motif having Dx(3-4)D or Dx(3-4)E [Alkaliphilus peptidifermentans DSM 18978]